MRFELFLAARYLRAKRRQAVVGVVTAISIAGVAAGVAALIIAWPSPTACAATCRTAARQQRPRAADAREADGIRDWQPLFNRLRRLPHVRRRARTLRAGAGRPRRRAPAARSSKAFCRTRKDRQHLLTTATPGSACMLSTRSPPGAAATALAAHRSRQGPRRDRRRQVGESRHRHQPAGRDDPARHDAQVVRFRLAGIFHSGFYQYDAQMGFMRLADAQRLFSEPDLLSVISFKVDDLDRARRLAATIEQAAGKGFMTTNWMEQNRELFRALKLEQVVTFIVIALIVIVAALNILIALTMMVMEKTRDIAVMMSFGVEPGQVRRIFLLQGLLISLIGTALGLVLGYSPPGPAATTTSSISPPRSTPSTRCPSPRARSTA
jgi:lipoprotein-releasing system permease protein